MVDLRGNPGGLLDAAVEIASYLVPEKSDVVSAKTRSGTATGVGGVEGVYTVSGVCRVGGVRYRRGGLRFL